MNDNQELLNAYAWFHGTVTSIGTMLSDGWINGDRAAEMIAQASAKLVKERTEFYHGKGIVLDQPVAETEVK